MSTSFYNTIGLNGVKLADANIQAINQEDAIYGLFERLKVPLTPSDVSLRFKQWPITSIRRAITNLTKDNRLEKMLHMKQGMYGKPEHTWRIKI